jgi:hypothetical protein
MRRYFEKLIDKISIPVFVFNGKKPWSFGYNAYKWRTIKEYLDTYTFNNGNLIDNYGFRIDERIIEYPWLFSRLSKEKGILLDAGSTLNYNLILNQPLLQSKKIFISTLAPEGNCYWFRGISYIFEDLRDCCYKDNFFDWITCISTAEHIGLDNNLLYTSDLSKKENNPNLYLNTITEFYRILKPGGILFITLPFGKKANRKWFQVFDYQMIDELITTFNPSSVIENHFRYQPTGWEKSSRELSKDATCFDINQQKDYDYDFAAFSRGIICLEMKK